MALSMDMETEVPDNEDLEDVDGGDEHLGDGARISQRCEPCHGGLSS